MKKLLITIIVAFAALLITQCRKANVQPAQANDEPFGNYEMTLNAGSGGDGKGSIEGLQIHWQLGDKLHVVDSTTGTYLGYLTATEIGDDKRTATYKGFITKPTVGNKCCFYFTGSHAFALDGEGKYTFDVSEQYGGLSTYIGNFVSVYYDGGEPWKGDFDDISNGLQLMRSMKGVVMTDAMLAAHDFGGESVVMRSMMAISRLNLKVNGTPMGGELTDIVTVTGPGCIAKAKLDIQTGALVAVPGQNTITLKKANNDYFMVLIPANQTAGGATLAMKFTATSKNGEVRCIVPTVATNGFYNYNGAGTVDMTLYLPGDFTVASGRTVKFSKGNLYWDGRFFKMEADQWDSAKTWNTNHVSHFFWSNTTDWQTPGKVPYAESYSYSTHSLLDVLFTNAADFRVEGQTGWWSLNLDEWGYLLNTRTCENRFAKAIVNNVKGLLVFPDGYTLPSGYTFEDGGIGMAPVNVTGAAYPSSGSIPGITWIAMQSSGVVFLPFSGQRNNNTSVENTGTFGLYWASSPDINYADEAQRLHFDSSGIYMYGGIGRVCGHAVRVVR